MGSFDIRSTCRLAGFVLLGALASAVSAAQPARNDDEIRQTVARISYLNGNVSYQRGDDPDNWQAADFNVPVTIGDRIWTGDDGRAELQVHGGFMIRVGALADLTALNLTDETKQWSLNAGYAAFQVRHLGQDEVFEVDTPNASITFERTGEYRVDVDADGNTRVTVRRGRALVAAGGGQVPLNAGDAMSIDGIDSPRYDIAAAGAPDGFDRWVSERQRRSETSHSRQYVNDSIVGVADLDEHGRWQSIPSYGMVWTPTVVEADWQPYRAGHWIWQDPWGWTWVAAEPWGWAPYHYGRWVNYSSRWWWVPVARSARVVYAPALVAFSGGGPGWSDGGGGFVGWFPLAPRDPFIHWWGPRRVVSVTTVVYVNRRFQTVVNHNTFVSGGIVTTNWVRDRAVLASVQQAPILRGPLPIVPTHASLRVAVRPDLPQPFRPPAAINARAVVVRVAPPPPPPTFQAKIEEIRQNRGEPIGPSAAARILEVEKGRGSLKPAYAVRPVAVDSGRMTFAPKTESVHQPKPEPVAPARGRSLARPGSSGPSQQATTPGPSTTPNDRGRRPDDMRRTDAKSTPPPTAVPTAHPSDRGRRPAPVDRRDQPPPTPAAAAPPAPTAAPLDRRRPEDRSRHEVKPTPVPQHQNEPPRGREVVNPRPTPVPERPKPTPEPAHEEGGRTVQRNDAPPPKAAPKPTTTPKPK